MSTAWDRLVRTNRDPNAGPLESTGIMLPNVVNADQVAAAATNNGIIYYDSTDNELHAIIGGARTTIGVAGAGDNTLDNAYDQGGAGAGRAITVDSGNVDLNLATAAQSLELDSSAAGVAVANALLFNTSGAGASITDAIDATDAGITNALNCGAAAIIGTTGNITYTNFSINGTTGALTCESLDRDTAGGLTIGGATATSVTITPNTTVSGTLQVNGAFTLDTADFTANGGNASFIITTAAGDGFLIDGSTVTTGNVLRLEYDAANMAATGAAISVTEDGVEVFSVAEDGLTTIAGTASGTDALVLTAGDILLTAGNVDLTNGNLTLAAGGLDVTAGAGDGDAFDLVNLAASAAIDLDMAAASVNAGGIIDIDGSTGSAPVLAVNMSGAYTGDYVALNMTNAVGAQAINLTGAGVRTVSLIEITDTPEGAAANTLDINVTPGATTLQVIDIDVAGTDDADIITMNFSGAYTGSALIFDMTTAVAATAFELIGAGVRTVALVSVTDTPSTLATFDLNITPAAAAAGANVIDIDVAGTGNADVIQMDFSAAYVGDGINITMTNAGATAQALVIDGGQTAGSVNMVSITSSSAFAAGTGRIMFLESTGALAAATEGAVLDISETGAVQATSYAVRIASTNNEALHVDVGQSIMDESLSVVGTGMTVGRGPNYFVAAGANNAITGTLNNVAGTAVPLADGLVVVVDLNTLTLQAGANTLNFNAGGALSIVSHNNVANNIGTAYAAQSHVVLCYNAGATTWEDLSQ